MWRTGVSHQFRKPRTERRRRFDEARVRGGSSSTTCGDRISQFEIRMRIDRISGRHREVRAKVRGGWT